MATETSKGETLSAIIAVCQRARPADRSWRIMLLGGTFRYFHRRALASKTHVSAGEDPALNHAAVQYYQRVGERQPLFVGNLNGANARRLRLVLWVRRPKPDAMHPPWARCAAVRWMKPCGLNVENRASSPFQGKHRHIGRHLRHLLVETFSAGFTLADFKAPNAPTLFGFGSRASDRYGADGL